MGTQDEQKGLAIEELEEMFMKIVKENEKKTKRNIMIYTQSEEMVDLFHKLLKEEANKFLNDEK